MTWRVVAATLDFVIAALAVLTAAIIYLGGFTAQLADFRLSFRTPSRTLFWIVVGVVARVATTDEVDRLGSRFVGGHVCRPVRVRSTPCKYVRLPVLHDAPHLRHSASCWF
jgi:hypothetical protein